MEHDKMVVVAEYVKCPVCGSDPRPIEHTGTYWLQCDQCNKQTSGYSTRNDAERAWNSGILLNRKECRARQHGYNHNPWRGRK